MVVTMQKLNADERTRLRTDFVVPLIVAQMLAGVEPLDEVAEYTIHDIIGDLKPDCGLLCVALCAAEIAGHYPRTPIAGVLAIEAERLIGEFGALWLRNVAEGPAEVNKQAIRESIVHLPEDLEVLADLLDTTQAELPEGDITARTLCDMLALQARVHAENAEEELHHIRLSPLSRAAVTGGNVVPFPGRR